MCSGFPWITCPCRPPSRNCIFSSEASQISNAFCSIKHFHQHACADPLVDRCTDEKRNTEASFVTLDICIALTSYSKKILIITAKNQLLNGCDGNGWLLEENERETCTTFSELEKSLYTMYSFLEYCFSFSVLPENVRVWTPLLFACTPTVAWPTQS